ncbi:MAG: translation initiation factor IF-3 [Desulfovibrionaceae bacterium]|nr:translation initiation factor IF-3 [Desulfovibrionaceae bacterium]
MEELTINPFNNQRGGRSKLPQQKGERCNEAIRATEVLVIGADGEQLGTLPIAEALSRARSAGLDLVEVSPDSKPPVCRIMDYGKRKYELQKKKQETKRRQNVSQIKEIRMRPKTDEHDYQTKLRHIIRFLREGDKCRVAILFRGREIVHKDRAEAMMHRIIEEIQDVGKVEQEPKIEGKALAMLLVPNVKK